MIDFPSKYPNPKLLKKAVNWAKKHKNHIPSLSALAKQDVTTLALLGKDWQELGLGTLIEVSEDGHRSVLFSLNEKAMLVVDKFYERSVWRLLCSFNRSEWIAFGAFIVSILALFKGD